jgi:quinol monooxygenase YgiN
MDFLEKHFNTSHFKKYVPLLEEMREASQLDIYEPVK